MHYLRILVVDDSRVARKIVCGMLAANGFVNLDEASSGKEALDLLARRTYRLVISDWNMLPVSGLELLAAIRRSERYGQLPFIMATAKTGRKFLEIARDNGATFYLEKPFSAHDLIVRVKSALRHDAAA